MTKQVVELLVHGVGGTAPTELLHDAEPEMVVGDGLAGFYRHRSYDLPLPDGPLPDGPVADGPVAEGQAPGVQEAYSWGGLTSGNASRAAWLILLPFALVNVSLWMRPRRRSEKDAGGIVYQAIARLLALSLTGTIVLAAGGVGVDLVGWQCAARTECGERWSILRFLTEGSWHEPGRRLVAGAAAPLAVVLLLWVLARRSWQAYESVHQPVPHPDAVVGADTDADAGGAVAAAGADAELAKPGFWQGARLVGQLRALHIALGFSVIALLLALPLWALGRSTTGGWWRSPLVAVDLVVIVGIAAATAAVPTLAGRRGDWVVRVLQGASGVVLAAAVLAAWVSDQTASGASRPGLPAFAGLVSAWLIVQLGLWVLMLVAAWPAGAFRRGQAMFGFAGPVFAALGISSGIAYSAALLTRVAGLLGSTQDDGGVRLAKPTAVVAWAAVAFGFEMAVIVLVALLTGLAVLIRGLWGCSAVYQEYDVAPPEKDSDAVDPSLYVRAERQARRIVRRRFVAGLTDRAGWYLVVLMVPLVAFALIVAWYRFHDGDPAKADYPATGSRQLIQILFDAGSWLVGVFALLVVGLAWRAYRNPSLRHLVGVLWDLGTFWPRAAHPLAPPCYAERCVPELTTRVKYLVDNGHGVVLSAHSQGSVLAAATLLAFPPVRAENVRLITYGAPLQRLYGWFFPAYFARDQLVHLHKRVPEWRNLWRETDPIGGPINLELSPPAVERLSPLNDPTSFYPPEGAITYPPIRWHLNYQADPAYAEELGVAVASLW